LFDAEIDSVRFRLAELEARLSAQRAQTNAPATRTEMIPFEVLQERYRDLLVKREDARTTAAFERRELGERYRVLEAARVPDRPIGPSRATVNATGAFAGFTFAVAALAWRRPPNART
jgi:hypothetical protein